MYSAFFLTNKWNILKLISIDKTRGQSDRNWSVNRYIFWFLKLHQHLYSQEPISKSPGYNVTPYITSCFRCPNYSHTYFPILYHDYCITIFSSIPHKTSILRVGEANAVEFLSQGYLQRPHFNFGSAWLQFYHHSRSQPFPYKASLSYQQTFWMQQ